jgi:hypothetical protein
MARPPARASGRDFASAPIQDITVGVDDARSLPSVHTGADVQQDGGDLLASGHAARRVSEKFEPQAFTVRCLPRIKPFLIVLLSPDRLTTQSPIGPAPPGRPPPTIWHLRTPKTLHNLR